jgi:hypothetical protein
MGTPEPAGKVITFPADRLLVEQDRLLRSAISGKRLVAFVLDGCRRIAEPHDYGVYRGARRLFFYQVGGDSRSRPATGWRWAILSKVSGLELLDDTFAGPRPAPTDRHVEWDALIATVSPRQRRRGEKGRP